jgi:branched-chain amino acid transport system substrate-binding protein
LSSDFAPIVNGVEAYFSMVNAQGGVAGRRLKLADQTDDQGSPTTDLAVSQKLVEQDQVFAVVGVGTPFFGGAAYLAQQGTPTFGYVVSTEWANKPTLFGAYGSTLDFSTAVPGEAYVAHQVGAKSIAVVAYGVPQSAEACRTAAQTLPSFGLNVSYTDLSFPFGSDPTADVLQMKSHAVDFVLSCLDVTGNVAFARTFSQNGVSVHQLWLDGYDRGTLAQYGSLMNGVFFGLQHVPFEAAQAFPDAYPGLNTYLGTMQRYQPAYTYDEVALEGWVSASLFVSGLRQVGRELTQKKLVAAINRDTSFTGDDLTTPVDWTTAHRVTSPPQPPFCGAGVEVVDGRFVLSVVPGTAHQVFACFDINSDALVPPKLGTPGT